MYYKSTKIYDKTSYTLDYMIRMLSQREGIHLTKVKALDIAVVGFVRMLEKQQIEKNKN